MATEATPPVAPQRTAQVRVFFALWPDAVTADALVRLAHHASPPAARRMRRGTLHLTLAFVGDIDAWRLPSLCAIGDSIAWPDCLITLDRVACWTHNHIVWAGCRQTPPALTALATQLRDALVSAGFEMPIRPFTPHVTLARKVLAPHWQTPAFEPIEWHIEGGRLVCSERDATGASNRVLADWTHKH